MIRVELVDDHTLMREGTCALLRDAPDIEIVAEAGHGEEALALARRLRPDVVLLDVRIPLGPSGVEVARALREHLPAIKVVILSAYAQEPYVRALSAIGVHGYVLKSASREDLAAALRAAQRGEQWLSPEVAARFAARKGRVMAASGALTERERDVLALLAEGKTNKQIAQALCLQPSTVESHVNNVLAKLQVHSRAEAIKQAAQQGIIALE